MLWAVLGSIIGMFSIVVHDNSVGVFGGAAGVGTLNHCCTD